MANRIGFTGSQHGMTQEQKFRLVTLLLEIYWTGVEFHHGDCIGADAEAAEIASSLNYFICSHPPENQTKRAFRKYDAIYARQPYLERNRCIVDHTELLIACPREATEQLRSGTWSTVRYARQKKRRICIIFPNGSLDGDTAF